VSMDAMTRLRRGLHKDFGPGAAAFVDPVLWMSGRIAVDLLQLVRETQPGLRRRRIDAAVHQAQIRQAG
jgi:hypothetical protein